MMSPDRLLSIEVYDLFSTEEFGLYELTAVQAILLLSSPYVFLSVFSSYSMMMTVCCFDSLVEDWDVLMVIHLTLASLPYPIEIWHQ